MATFYATVAIECDTIEQANIVLRERVHFDEQYQDDDGLEFDYSISLVGRTVEEAEN